MKELHICLPYGGACGAFGEGAAGAHTMAVMETVVGAAGFVCSELMGDLDESYPDTAQIVSARSMQVGAAVTRCGHVLVQCRPSFLVLPAYMLAWLAGFAAGWRQPASQVLCC